MDRQEGPDEDSHVVDIASLAEELKNKMNSCPSEADHGGDSQACPIIIGKVGDNIRNTDPVEYDPHHVSIGPYHRSLALYREEEKLRSLRDVLSARSPTVTVEDLKVYLRELKRLREQATRCYQQYHELEDKSSESFIRMMLLDACYLLTQFGDIDKFNNGCRAKLTDLRVVRDVFYLAENQLPFVVIDRVCRLSEFGGRDSAAVIFCRYVRELMCRLKYSVAKPDVEKDPGPGNLLHLLHMHFKPTVPPSSTVVGAATGDTMGRWRTATEYYNLAGVKFKKQSLDRGECESILDVRLVHGGSTLQIPYLNIDGSTWGLLRNLIALEQHNSGTIGSDVTAYCSFMSQLACTTSDVELLVRRGIISHTCGNHGDVAGFFSDLVKGVVDSEEDEENNYLRGTWQTLEKRFKSRRVRWMASIRHKYFRNPWLTVGHAAAGIGLACAVVQAVYSVLSYKR